MLDTVAHIAIYAQAVGSVVLLVGFLIATTLMQQRAVSQSTVVLAKASDAVKTTELYKSAVSYFERRQTMTPFGNPSHLVSTWLLVLVVFMCSLVTYFG